jgi:hypothetical protein
MAGEIISAIVLMPLLPFITLSIVTYTIAAWIDRWQWPNRFVDASERIHDWGQRGRQG